MIENQQTRDVQTGSDQQEGERESACDIGVHSASSRSIACGLELML